MSTPLFANLVAYKALTEPAIPPLTASGYEYLLAQNGVFLHARNRFVDAVVPVATFPPAIRGLHSLDGPQFTLRVPRLSPITLSATVRHADAQRDAAGNRWEAFYRFHHDGHHVRVVCPVQDASRLSVSSAGDGGNDVILELHSHGDLPAFWSGTDDRDEQGFRFYAVVGFAPPHQPEIRLRLGVYGAFLNLPLDTLFALPGPPAVDIPRDLFCSQTLAQTAQ